MKIIGIRPTAFKGDSGNVTGKNFYVSYPLEKEEGLGAERIFITDAKLNTWTYQPKVGDEMNVSYNHFGKHRLTMANTPLNKALGVRNQIFHSNDTRSAVAWTWERMMSATFRRSSKSMLSQFPRWEDGTRFFAGRRFQRSARQSPLSALDGGCPAPRSSRWRRTSIPRWPRSGCSTAFQSRPPPGPAPHSKRSAWG